MGFQSIWQIVLVGAAVICFSTTTVLSTGTMTISFGDFDFLLDGYLHRPLDDLLDNLRGGGGAAGDGGSCCRDANVPQEPAT